MNNTPSNAAKHTAERFRIVAVTDYLLETNSVESIEDITVSDICRNAGIPRVSFYRLFEDKYALANWFMIQCIIPGIAETGRTLTWTGGNIVSLSGAELMQHVMRAGWKSTGYHAMKETGIRRRRDDLIDTIVNWKGVPLTEELRFQADFYAHSESYVVRNWMADPNRCAVEEVSSRLELCVPPELHDLLKTPLDPRPPVRLKWSTLVMLSSRETDECRV